MRQCLLSMRSGGTENGLLICVLPTISTMSAEIAFTSKAWEHRLLVGLIRYRTFLTQKFSCSTVALTEFSAHPNVIKKKNMIFSPDYGFSITDSWKRKMTVRQQSEITSLYTEGKRNPKSDVESKVLSTCSVPSLKITKLNKSTKLITTLSVPVR